MEVPGYHLSDVLSRSPKSVVYSATTEGKSDAAVVLKMPPFDGTSSRMLARYEREYQTLNHLDSPLVVRPVRLVRESRRVVLVLEAATWGKTLSGHLGGGHLTVAQALRVMLKLVDALADIHRQGVVHRDLSPGNIIVDESLERFLLIDFGLATMLPDEPSFVGARSVRGTLAYLSPEQTGRMNRVVDYRSDYYSAGGLLYHMLTGRPPFVSDDVMELVYAQIARRPVPPKERNDQIPQPVSDIVMKLLEKAAEDRYQDVSVLRSDLVHCLEALETEGEVGPFEIAAHDQSRAFQIPQRLYGREVEIDRLSKQLDAVTNGGTRLVLVRGYSGIGKSALVQETWRLITQHRGSFARGKFDQFNRATPYNGLIEAFGQLIRQLMTEPEAVVVKWKQDIEAALLGNAQVLIDVIPELEWVLGEQPAVAEVAGAEAQNRFNRSLLSLFRVFASRERPLVLFLDDLQWVDRPTLSVIDLLMRESPDDQCLLLIGAYRSNEVDAAHPLSRMVSDVVGAGHEVMKIDLGGLSPNDTIALVRDTIGDNPGVESLAEVIHERTGGNPFFVRQFFTMLQREGMVQRVDDGGPWTWNIGEIRGRAATQNVVDVLLSRLRLLTPQAQRVLRLAACLGASFDLQTVAMVGEMELDEVRRCIGEAAREGFVTQVNVDSAEAQDVAYLQAFRFLHDRVQQASDTLLGDERLDVHLSVGRSLWRESGQGHPERLFEILDHLNVALDLVDSDEERLAIARLNLEAGQRAKRSTAFHSAVDYLRYAEACLPKRPRETHHGLWFEVVSELSECVYLAGDFDEARRLFDVALANAGSRLNKAIIYEKIIVAMTHESLDEEACAVVCEALDLFQLGVRQQPGQLAIVRNLMHTKWLLWRRSRASILEAPEMSDQEMQVCLRILLAVFPPAYQCGDNDLFAVAALKAVKLSLQHGIAPGTGYCFVLFGMMIGGALGQYRDGREYGELGLEILKRFNDPDMNGRALGTFGAMVHPWTGTIRASFPLMRTAYDYDIQAGNIIYAGYASLLELNARLQAGNPLSDLLAFSAEVMPFWEKAKDGSVMATALAVRECCHVLSDPKQNELHLIAAELGEPDVVWTQSFGTARSTIASLRLMVAYLLEDDEAGMKAAGESTENVVAAMASVMEPLHYLWLALFYCRMWRKSQGAERRKMRRGIRIATKKMATWSALCPENFQHQHELIQGAWALAQDDPRRALTHLDRAITGAREHLFIHHEAVSCELAHEAVTRLGFRSFSSFYGHQAQAAYRAWGATRKATRMDTIFDPGHLPGPAGGTFSLGTISVSGSASANLDLESVLKASQALSQEVRLPNLVSKLMRIAIENAGAQRGVLVLRRHDRDWIEAVSTTDFDAMEVLQGLPLDKTDRLPEAVARYVLRTGETLVLHDPHHKGLFVDDPYVKRVKPGSIYCAALRHKDLITGLLYLEHRDTSRVFDASRMQLPPTLLTQAAISLENARLVDRLVTEVGERRRAEKGERQLLDIIEATPDLVAIIALNGALLYVNGPGREMMGLSSTEELQQHNLGSLLVGRDHGKILEEGVAAAARDGHWSGECLYRSPDGRFAPMLLAVIAHRSQAGDVDHYSAIGRDITEFKRLEEQFRQTAKMEAVGQLAGGVAHDFNNLLGVITGFTELVKSSGTGPGDQTQEWLDQILTTCKRGADLVARLMAFSRKDVGNKEALDVHRTIERVESLLTATIDPRIRVQTSLKAVERVVIGDSARLDAALLNLALNARDAMPEGGTLTFETRNLNGTEKVEVVVRDTGLGMSDEVQARIFEPFFTTKAVGSGTGLGLAATYGTVESMGGHIEVQSVLGEGACFRIELPVGSLDDEGEAPVHAKPRSGAGRILVVDDEVMIRKVLTGLLGRLGYDVITAEDGPAGVEMFRQRHQDLDLVILDMTMPRMSGNEALELMREIDEHVPVLISSGNANAHELNETLAQSVVGFLQKPFTLSTLSRHVANALESKDG